MGSFLVFTRLTSELPWHRKDDERDHCHGEHRRSSEYRDRHHGTPELSWEPLPQWSKVSPSTRHCVKSLRCSHGDVRHVARVSRECVSFYVRRDNSDV